MNEQDRETIRKNRVKLRDNIANPDDINELLFERGVFTEAMKQEVEAEMTDIKKMQKILDLVPRRGSQAFDKFYQILIDTENMDAAGFLKPAPAVEELPADWPNEKAMTEEVKVIHCSESSDVFRKYWKDSMTYSMKKKKRGRAVVINNTNFYGPMENGMCVLPYRKGTEKDRNRLKTLFEQLYFEVTVHEEQKGQDIRNALAKETSDIYHKTADCFILTILSHGSRDGIYGVDGDVVSIEDITNFFASNSCPNLAGKPKIFFIQACQGEEKDLGGVVNTGPDISDILDSMKGMNLNQPDAKSDSEQSKEDRIATKRDMLIASATHPGFISLRNTLHGSWFIQAVILVFQKYAHEEELSVLLRKVNNVVSRGKVLDQATKSDIFQASCYRDSFINKFYFFPGCHE